MARQIGLKNIYVAKLLTDNYEGVAYATPVKLEKGIKATIKPKSSSMEIKNGSALLGLLDTFNSIEMTIELNQLSLASRALLQGSKIIKGQLVENKNNIASVIALGFQSQKTDGSIRYVWLYKGKFSRTEDSYETESDKVKDQTASLTGTFFARRYDGNYRIIADSNEPNIDTNVIDNWFITVPAIPV